MSADERLKQRRNDMSLRNAIVAAGTLASVITSTSEVFAAACEDSSQAGRFVVKADEVLDTKTNLTWQRCSIGQQLVSDTCSGTVGTFTWEQAKKRAGGGWRLPTLDELSSIVSQPCGLTAADKKAFPVDSIKSSYWTATATEKDLAWMVGFNNGSTFNGFRTAPNAVRLVKGGK
jgi:hypothetical protein